jgi:RHS repeat-associated protein
MEIKERSWSVSSYRYGFNGKEKDSEGMGGGGATYDYGFRIYNPQLGKFLSVDPLTSSFPSLTPYQFASNMPIVAIDLDGLEAEIFHNHYTSTSLGRSLFKIVNKTRLAKQFQEVLKSQNKFDVYYVPFTSKYSDAEGIVHDGLGHNPDGTIDDFGGARGYTFTFKSLDDAKKQIARNYALHNVLIEDLEKSFEDGKEVIVVVIADVFTDGKSIFDKNKTTIDNAFTMLKSLKEGAETVLHEQTAHVINRLKGIEKTTKEEHGDYHGDKTITSPTIEDIETKGKYKNTTAREAVNQINEVIDEMEAKLESKR